MNARAIPTRRRPVAVDLFSGCGGLTLGLKQAGFRVAGAIEIEDVAAKTYRMNHRATQLWQGDIREIPATAVLRAIGLARGELDLLAACPPCQGFSTIRTRNRKNSVSDDRNDLIFEVARFARVMRPRAIMMENVPRLMHSHRFRRLVTILRSIGYECESRVLDAADYGVPQRRRRMILVCIRGGRPMFARESNARVSVRDAIGHLADPSDSTDELHRIDRRHSARVLRLIERIPKDGGSRSALEESVLRCHQDFDGFRDVYGRMNWAKVSPTITGGCVNPSKGRFLHPARDRAISLREAALLQSFPLRYKFSLDRGIYSAAQMIGNALPPEFIRRHAAAIRQALRESSQS